MRKYQVAIFRHAEAETAADEMERSLTSQGVSDAINTLSQIPSYWQTLLCSPAIRTQQTGQYLTNLFPIVIERLYTNHSPTLEEIELLYDQLIPYTNKGHCMIVTHQPIIIPLISRFQERNIDIKDVKTCEGVILLEDGSLQWIQR